MSYITAGELELLSFFEVEPQKADPDVAWPYNDFTYHLVLGSYEIIFGIYPAYKDLSFSIRHEGTEFYKLVALAVEDVRYHRDADTETLEIAISDRESIWLRLRPTLLLAQDVAAET